MILVTYANIQPPGVQNWLASVRKWNHEFMILGQGEPWRGYMTRIQAFRDCCRQMRPDQMLVFCDCFDLFVCRPAQDMLDVFATYQCDILLGAEPFCFPGACYADQHIDDTVSDDEVCRFVNMGCVMGTAEKLLWLYELILASGMQDDQFAAGWMLTHHRHGSLPNGNPLDFPNKGVIIRLDTAGLLCHNFSCLNATASNSTCASCMIHTPGSSVDGHLRYNLYGYRLLHEDFQPLTHVMQYVYSVILIVLLACLCIFNSGRYKHTVLLIHLVLMVVVWYMLVIF